MEGITEAENREGWQARRYCKATDALVLNSVGPNSLCHNGPVAIDAIGPVASYTVVIAS